MSWHLTLIDPPKKVEDIVILHLGIVCLLVDTVKEVVCPRLAMLTMVFFLFFL